MSESDGIAESLKGASKADFAEIFNNVIKSIQTGEVVNDPHMMLALALVAGAGIIIFVCVLLLLFKRSGSALDNSALHRLESRMQALEIAINDQKNLVKTLKNQNAGDFGYYKQELQRLNSSFEELQMSVDVLSSPKRLRAASNY